MEAQTSLEKLRELSGTTKQGTTLLGSVSSSQSDGVFGTRKRSGSTSRIIDHKEPLILHVVMEDRLQHYVVCYGYDRDKFIVGDPAKGITTYTKEELESVWKSKTCLTLTPNDNFVRTKTQSKNKKQWFLKLLKEDYRLISFSVLLGLAIAILGMAMAIFSQKLIDDILPSKDFHKTHYGHCSRWVFVID